MLVSFFDDDGHRDIEVSNVEELTGVFRKTGDKPKMNFKRSTDFVEVSGDDGTVEISANGLQELKMIAAAFGAARGMASADFNESSWRFTF